MSELDQIKAVLNEGFYGRTTPEETAKLLAELGVTGITITSATITINGRTLSPTEAERLLSSAYEAGHLRALPAEADASYTPASVREHLDADNWLGRGQVSPF